MSLAWRSIDPSIQQAVHDAQVPWIGTRYSAHQRQIGCGTSCYGLMGSVFDSLYRKPQQSPLPLLNPNAGIAGNHGLSLVSSFLRHFPLDSVALDGCIEPGDLIVTRSIPGLTGKDWMGHAMMAGKKPGQVIHAMPATGVTWGSLVTSIGRVVRVYRPRDKGSWA